MVWYPKGFACEPQNLGHIRRFGSLIGHGTTGMKMKDLAHYSQVGEQHVLKIDDSGTMVVGNPLGIVGERCCLGFQRAMSGKRVGLERRTISDGSNEL